MARSLFQFARKRVLDFAAPVLLLAAVIASSGCQYLGGEDEKLKEQNQDASVCAHRRSVLFESM